MRRAPNRAGGVSIRPAPSSRGYSTNEKPDALNYSTLKKRGSCVGSTNQRGGRCVGSATPVAFSHLAASTPEERMGRTMGSAELGRELGDAGGPLIAGAVGTASVAGLGLLAVAALTAGAGALAALGLRRR